MAFRLIFCIATLSCSLAPKSKSVVSCRFGIFLGLPIADFEPRAAPKKWRSRMECIGGCLLQDDIEEWFYLVIAYIINSF